MYLLSFGLFRNAYGNMLIVLGRFIRKAVGLLVPCFERGCSLCVALNPSSCKRWFFPLLLLDELELDLKSEYDSSDWIDLLGIIERFSSFPWGQMGVVGTSVVLWEETVRNMVLLFAWWWGAECWAHTGRLWYCLRCRLFCSRIQHVCLHLLLHLGGDALSGHFFTSSVLVECNGRCNAGVCRE